MPESEKPLAQEEQEIDSIRLDTFIKIYTNSAQIETSVWDLKIIFGELTRASGKHLIEQSVAVSMSPQHAKALLGILGKHVQEYEKRFGEMKLPSPEPEALVKQPAEPTHEGVQPPHTHKEAPAKA